ncbi:SSU ribosomal protein S16p [Olavius algarvensis spirochete endosymbiont]|uniref:30S ribosomal protein S16 n=1 Tax=Olavius algarvensis spirochete endosymbiont TaxID=260710 RepID=UPI000F2A0C2F|nr:30S ribosomal protein S16 [Olavius algarvensis spirochete endosymbiont]VDA99629.1 SSU ribosomal protein S16p [Olavius algarvensis spirochete endosymbiont]
MSVKIRLKRMGTKKRPYYRIVIMDSRAPRDGRTIEELGYYHPIESRDKQVSVKADRVREWLEKGAQPTPTVKQLLNKNSITIR